MYHDARLMKLRDLKSRELGTKTAICGISVYDIVSALAYAVRNPVGKEVVRHAIDNFCAVMEGMHVGAEDACAFIWLVCGSTAHEQRLSPIQLCQRVEYA